MSDFTVEAFNGLLKGAAHFLGQRKHKRDIFFERVILKRHEEFRAILKAQHGSLAPYVRALEDLARGAQDQATALETTRALSAALWQLNVEREMGLLDRQELARFASDLERSGYVFGGARFFLSQEERAMLRTFMSAICSYFIQGGKYQHAHVNLLNYMIMSVDTWLHRQRIEPAVVRYVAQDLVRGLETMESAWGKVTNAFHRLELSIQFDFQIQVGCEGRARCLPLAFQDAA